MAREIIDIESLLIRAYHEKRVDRFGTGDERNRRILGKLILGSYPSNGGGGGFAGERVQSSCFASKMADREGRLWAQLDLGGDVLMAVHDAVLGLPTFYAEPLGQAVDAEDLAFAVWDPETALAMGHRIEATKAGATIERVRRRGGSDVRRANELRPAGPKRRVIAIEISNFLICHGRAADRPFVPDVELVGRRPVYRGADKRAAAHSPIYATPLSEVVRARAIYATWHACLGLLQARFADLAALDVTGPMAPPAPWEIEAGEIERGPAPRARRAGRNSGKYPASAMA